MTARTRGDAGQLSLSAIITVPAVFLFIALVIMAGRLADARGAVDAAANEAARAASISRTVSDAEAAAQAAAEVTLGASDLDCTATTVTADLNGFSAPTGRAALVTVTVACTVPLSELIVLGVGDGTITAAATSAIDIYRSRQ